MLTDPAAPPACVTCTGTTRRSDPGLEPRVSQNTDIKKCLLFTTNESVKTITPSVQRSKIRHIRTRRCSDSVTPDLCLPRVATVTTSHENSRLNIGHTHTSPTQARVNNSSDERRREGSDEDPLSLLPL